MLFNQRKQRLSEKNLKTQNQVEKLNNLIKSIHENTEVAFGYKYPSSPNPKFGNSTVCNILSKIATNKMYKSTAVVFTPNDFKNMIKTPPTPAEIIRKQSSK